MAHTRPEFGSNPTWGPAARASAPLSVESAGTHVALTGPPGPRSPKSTTTATDVGADAHTDEPFPGAALAMAGAANVIANAPTAPMHAATTARALMDSLLGAHEPAAAVVSLQHEQHPGTDEDQRTTGLRHRPRPARRQRG